MNSLYPSFGRTRASIARKGGGNSMQKQDRGKSFKTGFNFKSVDDQIATRYKYVSLFGWYPPQKLSSRSNKPVPYY